MDDRGEEGSAMGDVSSRDEMEQMKERFEEKMRELENFHRLLLDEAEAKGLGHHDAEMAEKLSHALDMEIFLKKQVEIMTRELQQHKLNYERQLQSTRNDLAKTRALQEQMKQRDLEDIVHEYTSKKETEPGEVNDDLEELAKRLSQRTKTLEQEQDERTRKIEKNYEEVFNRFMSEYRKHVEKIQENFKRGRFDFENDIMIKFQNILTDHEKECDDRLQHLEQEYNNKIKIQRDKWEIERKSQLDLIAKEVQSKAKEMEVEESTFRKKLDQEYKEKMKSLKEEGKRIEAQMEKMELDRWEQRQREFRMQEEEQETAKHAYREMIQKKFKEMLDEKVKNDENLWRQMERRYNEELALRDQKVRALEDRRMEENERLRKELAEREEDLSAELRRFEERVVVNFERMLEEHARKQEEIITSQEQVDLRTWEEREAALKLREDSLERKRMTFEDQIRAKYDGLLRQQREASRNLAREQEQQFEAVLLSLNNEIDAARNERSDAISKLKSELEQQEGKMDEIMANLEDELIAKFEKMKIEKIKEKEEEVKRLSEIQLCSWEKRQLEYIRREEQLEKARLEYEEELRHRFDNVLQEKAESDLSFRKDMERKFQKDMKDKDREIEVLEAKIAELEHAMRELMDKEMEQEAEHRRYEEELIAKYEKQMSEHKRKTVELIDARDAAELKRWEEREREFRSREESIATQRRKAEMDIRTVFERQQSQLVEEDIRARKDIERQFDREMKRRESQMQEIEDRRRELELITKELMDRELEQETTHRRIEDELMTRYEKQLHEHMIAIDELTKSKEGESSSRWYSREMHMTDREGLLERSKIQFENDVREKYDRLLAHAKSTATDARHEVAKSYDKELKKREEEIEDAIKAHHSKRLDYEKQVRDKYIQMVRIFQNEVQIEKKTSLDRDLEDMQRRTEMEKERQTVYEEAERKAEKDAKERYRKMLLDLQETWRKEAENRERRVEESLKAQYEGLIQSLQLELEGVLNSNNNTDEAQDKSALAKEQQKQIWMNEIAELKKEQLHVLALMEDNMKREFDEMLVSVGKTAEDDLRHYDSRILQAQDAMRDEERTWSEKMKSVETSFTMWRADYEKEMSQKYTPVMENLNSLTATYAAELTAAATDDEQRRDREIRRKSDNAERRRRLAIEQDSIRKKRDEEKFALEQKIVDDNAKKQKLSSLQHTLEKLWEALDSDPNEQVRFLLKACEAAGGNSEVSTLFDNEYQRVSARLPITQAIQKRESIKLKLKNNEYTTSGGKDALVRELRVMNESLQDRLDRYEQRHGERFTYRGVDYLKHMKGGDSLLPVN